MTTDEIRTGYHIRVRHRTGDVHHDSRAHDQLAAPTPGIHAEGWVLGRANSKQGAGSPDSGRPRGEIRLRNWALWGLLSRPEAHATHARGGRGWPNNKVPTAAAAVVYAND